MSSATDICILSNSLEMEGRVVEGLGLVPERRHCASVITVNNWLCICLWPHCWCTRSNAIGSVDSTEQVLRQRTANGPSEGLTLAVPCLLLTLGRDGPQWALVLLLKGLPYWGIVCDCPLTFGRDLE